MVHTTVAIRVPAPISEVWRTYADFGAVKDWSPVVARSYLTSETVDGLGTSRHCDLVPRGAVARSLRAY